MNTNKQIRFLLWGFLFLLVLNGILLIFLLRQSRNDEMDQLKRVQIRLDSISNTMELSRQRVDSVLGNIGRTLELSRQLDEEVINLSSGYEKDRKIARQKLSILKEQIMMENNKLKSLQHELRQM